MQSQSGANMNRKQFFKATAGALVIGGLPTGLRAQLPSNDRIRIVTGLRATPQSLGWLGTEAGIFKRNGLDVIFPRPESGGPEAAAGLIRGDWEFVHTGSSPLIQGVVEGHDTVILLTPLYRRLPGLPSWLAQGLLSRAS